MCGISVSCEFDAAPAAIDRVRAMHARVAHRGPDGEGWLAIDDAWTTPAAVSEDARRRSVTLSRDRFGIRPLFYRLDGGRLLVGSEGKQVAWLEGERPPLNRAAMVGFLHGRRVPRDATYFEGVRAVPPATWTTLS